jgi:DNA-binding MarR family transcriptional regulator
MTGHGVWRHARVQLVLCAHGTGLTTGELSKRIDFDNAEIGTALRSYEKRGHVERVPGITPTCWTLTELGRACCGSRGA